MKKCSEAYSKGIAFAVRYWARREDPAAVATLPSLAHLSSACSEFDGGSAANELFWPRRFQGQRIALRRPSSPPDSLSALESPSKERTWPNSQSSSQLPGLPGSPQKVAQTAETSSEVCLRIPLGTRPGDEVEAEARGQCVRVQVVEGMHASQLVQLRRAEDAVTYAAVAAVTTATTTASTMVVAEICRRSMGASTPEEIEPKSELICVETKRALPV